jgi:nucleotide-binding universal stress UspA family protein
MLTVKTILHPTDFSEGSRLAFRLACALAQDFGARLVVLHVAEPPAVVYGKGILVLEPQVDPERLRERLQEITPRGRNVQVEHRLAQGDVVTEILRIAQETQADVIMMGTHGRTGLKRLLMGSVAEQVVRKAACPVLTVKTPLPQVRPSRDAVPALAGEVAEAVKR